MPLIANDVLACAAGGAPARLAVTLGDERLTFGQVLTMCPTGWFVPTLDGPEYLEDSMMETFGIGELKAPD